MAWLRVKGASQNSYYWLHVQVFGANPTTIRIRAWADGTSEPTSWTYSVNDANSNLQSAGSIGLRTYLSSAAPNAPVTFTFNNLLVTDNGGSWVLNTSVPQLAQAYHPLSYVVAHDTSHDRSTSAPAADPAVGVTKYYYFGSQRVAMWNSQGLFYIYTDHLGSTNQIMHGTDPWYSTEWYYPFGGVRSTGGNHDSPTDYEFTGQKKDSTGLMYYGARYYAPGLARFIQPDSVVPDPSNPQSLNRYSYVLNNPLRYVDPSGHTSKDYYVFVQGCINIPNQQAPCQGDPKVDWHNYLDLLRQQIGLGENEFATWITTHVRFVRAFNADPSEIAKTISGIDPGEGEIFLLGHSAGGAAILNYLAMLRASGNAPTPHIGGAISLDAPIGDSRDPFSNFVGAYIGFAKYSGVVGGRSGIAVDRFRGLGAWAKAKGLAVLTVSYGGDWINPTHQFDDVPFHLFPDNPDYDMDNTTWGILSEDLTKRHGCLFSDPTGLHGVFQYIVSNQYLR